MRKSFLQDGKYMPVSTWAVTLRVFCLLSLLISGFNSVLSISKAYACDGSNLIGTWAENENGGVIQYINNTWTFKTDNTIMMHQWDDEWISGTWSYNSVNSSNPITIKLGYDTYTASFTNCSQISGKDYYGSSFISNFTATKTSAPTPTPTPVPTHTPTPTPVSNYFFKENFSWGCGNTWTGNYCEWYVDSSTRLNIDKITPGMMGYCQTAFHPIGYFIIDTDVNVISIANEGGFGIMPLGSGTLFTYNNMTFIEIGAIIYFNNNTYYASLLGFDSTGQKWVNFMTPSPISSSITSIGLEYSMDTITLRINKQNTVYKITNGYFESLPSQIDSLKIFSQGNSSHVCFDNIYATQLSSECTATSTLNNNLDLYIPNWIPPGGQYEPFPMSMKLTYVPYPNSIIFKTNINNDWGTGTDPNGCAETTFEQLSYLRIPDLKLWDGSHLWAILQYTDNYNLLPASAQHDGCMHFIVSDFGVFPSN